MDALRLFVALELEERARAALHAWAVEAAPDDVRVVRAEGLHVTVAFIGSRPPSVVERVAATLRAAACDPGPLTTAGALWLPPRRPDVLTVGLRVTATLGVLQEALAVGLEQAIGLPRDTRPFRPHVTVGRVRRGARVAQALPPPPDLTFSAPALALYVSRSAKGGSRYEALARVGLGRIPPISDG